MRPALCDELTNGIAREWRDQAHVRDRGRCGEREQQDLAQRHARSELLTKLACVASLTGTQPVHQRRYVNVARSQVLRLASSSENGYVRYMMHRGTRTVHFNMCSRTRSSTGLFLLSKVEFGIRHFILHLSMTETFTVTRNSL